MDIENVTEQPIVVHAGGERIAFPLLNFRQLGRMLTELRAVRLQSLVESLQKAGVSEKARVEALRDFDSKSLSLLDGMRWCYGVEGTVATLTASLRVAKPDMTDEEVDAVLAKLPGNRLMDTASQLWGAVFNVGRGGEPTEESPLDRNPSLNPTGQ